MESDTYDGLLPRALPRFMFPPLSATSRAIVIGMGGGCDVFAAGVMCKLWKSQPSTESGATVLFANCVGPRPLPEDHEPLTPHLYRLPCEPVPLVPGDEAYGSTRLELSMDRGDEGSPYLLVVPKDGKSGLTLNEVYAANSAALAEALRHLGIEFAVAVDLGGDSLTGGSDYEGGNIEFGRDRQVLHALTASGIPFLQIVLGPGCDGESSVEAMQDAIRTADEAGSVLGALPIEDVVADMAELAKTLRPSRTPHILASAVSRVKQTPAPTDGETNCVIERHGNRAEIPWKWLTVAIAIKGCGV